MPSLAVDVYPCSYDYDAGNWSIPLVIANMLNQKITRSEGMQRINRVNANFYRFYFFAGIVKGIAWELGIGVRWGGDWDSDNDLLIRI